MKNCQAFHDWLDGADPLTLGALPDHLADHVHTCPDCTRHLEGLQQVRQQALAAAPLVPMMDALWQKIDQGLDRTPDPTPAPAPAPTAGRETPAGWLDSLFAGHLGWAGAVAVLVLGLGLGFWLTRAPSFRPLGRIEGAGGDLVRQAKHDNLSTTPIDCLFQDRVELAGAQAWAKIAFRDGRGITIEGLGRLHLTEEGFRTEDGSFRAAFDKGHGSFKVDVPGACLGIRGTTIWFALKNEEGELELLEGQVEVSPTDGRPSFEWQTGTKLQIRQGKLLPVGGTPSNPDQPGASAAWRYRQTGQ